VALQPDQRGPGRLLALPGLGDGLRPGCADAGNLPQPLGRVVKHVRRVHAEVRDDAPRDGWADAGNQPAAQIALQAGQAGGHHRPHLDDLELPAVARVLHPVAEQLYSLACREERHHADDSHGRGAVRLELGHRVAGLVVTKGQRADRAAQRLRHTTGLGPGGRRRECSKEVSGSATFVSPKNQKPAHMGRKTPRRGGLCVRIWSGGVALHPPVRAEVTYSVQSAVIGATSLTPHSSIRSSQSSPASHGASSVEAPCTPIWLPYTPARNAARRSSG